MIEGLTHNHDGSPMVSELAVVGKLSHATKPKGHGIPPIRLDHFKAMVRDEKGEWVDDDDVLKDYGPKPKKVKIVLLYDDPERNFRTNLSWYSRSAMRLICMGNGRVAKRRIKEDQPWEENYPCNYKTCPDYQARRCKPQGTLYFNLANDLHVGKCFKYSTSSWQGINQILESMRKIKEMTKRVAGGDGYLAGLPITLELNMYKKSFRKGDGGHGSTKAAILNLDLPGAYDEVRSLILKHKPESLSHGENFVYPVIKEIVEDAQLDAETVDEFYPDNSISMDDNSIIIGDVSVPELLYIQIDKMPISEKEKTLNRIRDMTQSSFDENIKSIQDYVNKFVTMVNHIVITRDLFEKIEQIDEKAKAMVLERINKMNQSVFDLKAPDIEVYIDGLINKKP